MPEIRIAGMARSYLALTQNVTIAAGCRVPLEERIPASCLPSYGLPAFNIFYKTICFQTKRGVVHGITRRHQSKKKYSPVFK